MNVIKVLMCLVYCIEHVRGTILSDRSLNDARGDFVQAALYKKFHKHLQIITNKKILHCKAVIFKVAFFPSTQSGRRISVKDLYVEPFSYDWIQNSCGIIIISNNLKWPKIVNGWNIININVSNFLYIGDFSNEVQRLAHYTKTAAPQIFLNAERIFYGDMKCPLQKFVLACRDKKQDVITLRHPARFKRPLLDEFHATKNHMQKRNESKSVFDDIDKLALTYKSKLKSGYVANMPDTMCIAYYVNFRTKNFSRFWSYTIRTASMREQLSFNVDIDKSILNSKTDVLYL